MLANEIHQSDLMSNLVETINQRVSQIESLAEKIKSYNSEENNPDIDYIFCEASSLRNRRLDIAVYHMAMHSKNNSSKKLIDQAKSAALLEVRRSLESLKNGVDAWTI